MTAMFEPRSSADVARLIAEYPLAWVVSRDFKATPLPLLAEIGPSGEITSLLGHFAKRNAQIDALRSDRRALILFLGPHGYMSPTLVSNKTWGPTWNYAVARFEVDIEFLPDDIDMALARLVDHVESNDETSWSIGDMGERYDELRGRVIAFRAHVRERHATFKLGQDEQPETLTELIAGVEGSDLARWMEGQRGAGR